MDENEKVRNRNDKLKFYVVLLVLGKVGRILQFSVDNSPSGQREDF